MIVQTAPDGSLLLFRQTDHALLSAAFAHAWGGDFPSIPRRESTLIAAARHDDGWSDWELAPTLRSDGHPTDFISIPVAEHVPLYRRGIDLVETEDPFAALVASLHGERLYTRPFHPGMDPRIDHLRPDEAALAQPYVDHEGERQRRLATFVAERDGVDVADVLADVLADAEEAWRLLQVWDRLSLLVCLQDPSAADQTFPPVRGPGSDVAIAVTGRTPDTLLLDPYPFARAGCAFSIEARRVPGGQADTEAFRAAYRTAEPLVVSFRCTAR